LRAAGLVDEATLFDEARNADSRWAALRVAGNAIGRAEEHVARVAQLAILAEMASAVHPSLDVLRERLRLARNEVFATERLST